MQNRNHNFFNPNYDFGTDNVFVELNEDQSTPFPPIAGNFVLLNGTDFLLLDGTNFLLL
ncbi:MAG TPA: hypothetical protein VKR58_08700 [Aquella sp.]|nr:hypothetical protein [Aquella sp.]